MNSKELNIKQRDAGEKANDWHLLDVVEISYQFEKKLSKSDLLERKRMSKKKQLLVVQINLIPSIEEERPVFLLIFLEILVMMRCLKKIKTKFFGLSCAGILKNGLIIVKIT